MNWLIQFFFLTLFSIMFIGYPSWILWENVIARAAFCNFWDQLGTLNFAFWRVIVTYNRYTTFISFIFIKSVISSIHIIDSCFSLFWTIRAQLFLEGFLVFCYCLSLIEATIIICYICISTRSIIIIVWVLSSWDRWMHIGSWSTFATNEEKPRWLKLLTWCVVEWVKATIVI